ncbi:MAG: diguanylate cyclase [Gammaproteobacteria bacterium]
MESKANEKSADIQEQRDDFAAGLAGRMGNIHECWAAIRRDLENGEQVNKLHRLLRDLVDSAGPLGYRRLGQLARKLEKLVVAAGDSQSFADSPQYLAIGPQLLQLQAIASSGPNVAGASKTAQRYVEPTTDLTCIYVIEDDETQAQEMVAQLGAYGWNVSAFANVTEAKAKLRETLPAALVVNVVLPEGELKGPELIQQVESLDGYRVPRVVISSRWDWAARLAAVRARADAFLVKPIDYTELAETLDKLTERHDSEPYRVLIVDDTVALAEHYAQVLRLARVNVAVVNDPSMLLEKLSAFKPELILMDLSMPQCTGIEAAKVIRQDSDYLGVPLVFMSSKTDQHRQLAAIEIGADDFLEKPIADNHLIDAVKIRAERFRSLATLIRQDSLTGLLNQISFKLQLEAELSRTLRANSPMTIAILDIDRFKQINGKYGHPAGDRVIRSVAKLLTKRLRKADIIGRYGGQEFAVVMPDTNLDSGLAVLNDLREQFAHIVYGAGEAEFACTVSIGVASTVNCDEMDTLIQAAETALYNAKQSGRNGVCSEEVPLSKAI